MRFGQFILSKATKEKPCRRDSCQELIIPGEEYAGLIIRPTGDKKPFSIVFHERCFFPGIRESKERREEITRNNQHAPRPYRLKPLEPEVAHRKKLLVHKLSVVKAQLIRAYYKKNIASIERNKASLVQTLTELNSPEFAYPYWWRFGKDLIELLYTGVDPKLSGRDAEFADQSSPEAALRLLSDTEVIPIDTEIEYELAEEMLCKALDKDTDDLPICMKNFAKLLDAPQALFQWSPELESLTQRRVPSLFDSERLYSAKASNAYFADYLREIAGKLNARPTG